MMSAWSCTITHIRAAREYRKARKMGGDAATMQLVREGSLQVWSVGEELPAFKAPSGNRAHHLAGRFRQLAIVLGKLLPIERLGKLLLSPLLAPRLPLAYATRLVGLLRLFIGRSAALATRARLAVLGILHLGHELD